MTSEQCKLSITPTICIINMKRGNLKEIGVLNPSGGQYLFFIPYVVVSGVKYVFSENFCVSFESFDLFMSCCLVIEKLGFFKVKF